MCSPTRSTYHRRPTRCTTTRRRCRTCTTTIGDFGSGLLAGDRVGVVGGAPARHRGRHRRRPPRRRVPGRSVGREHVVVALARRPRRGGQGAGRRGQGRAPTGGPPSNGWRRSEPGSSTVRRNACSRADSSPQLDRGSGACATAHTPRSFSRLLRTIVLTSALTMLPYNVGHAGAVRASGPSTEGGAATAMTSGNRAGARRRGRQERARLAGARAHVRGLRRHHRGRRCRGADGGRSTSSPT